MGGNVNNTGWDYIRMGGKAAAVLDPATVYLKTNFTFEKVINRIFINIVGLDTAEGDEVIYLQTSLMALLGQQSLIRKLYRRFSI